MNVSVDKEVGSFEAKNRLSALIEEASRGQRIWITRHGKRVALLSSGLGDPGSTGISLVVRFGRVRGASSPGAESIKALIEEGRR